MSRPTTNVVRPFPRRVEQIGLVERRRLGLTSDRRYLDELQLRLGALKQELAGATAAFNEALARVGRPDCTVRPQSFVEQIEALEAGMHRLAGAMTAHQPR